MASTNLHAIDGSNIVGSFGNGIYTKSFLYNGTDWNIIDYEPNYMNH